ncbi:MAG TPA: sugar phosphate nucleotidyltransferase [Anaerolineaceae bacterium]|nr:sugar phosphate nucleotidyltransferase [Anaerolineaceae bacterium]HOR83727.1 sugar phosphate nucleotidyltransferase [Anaerolineaceae bacterium]
MRAVILAGGRGTRLAPYTYVLPKPMMPIGDKAILEILLRQMKRAGINHVVLTVGHLAGLMRAFFQDGQQYDLDITYSYEATPLGTAGPLALVPNLDKTFMVSNGDVLTLLDFNDFINFHHEQGGICSIAMHKHKVHIDLGVVEQNNGDYVITGYVEKPTLDYRVSMGVYIFEPRVLDYIPKNEYLDFPDLVKTLLANGERVIGYPFNGYWRDLGNPGDYTQACLDFDQMRSLFLPE